MSIEKTPTPQKIPKEKEQKGFTADFSAALAALKDRLSRFFEEKNPQAKDFEKYSYQNFKTLQESTLKEIENFASSNTYNLDESAQFKEYLLRDVAPRLEEFKVFYENNPHFDECLEILTLVYQWVHQLNDFLKTADKLKNSNKKLKNVAKKGITEKKQGEE